MTSKRNLKREVQELEEESASENSGVHIFVERHFETPEAAPRPELVVPANNRRGYSTVAPNVSPDNYAGISLLLTEDVVDTWDTREGVFPVSELWDSLTEEQLRKEWGIRQEHGEPIPEVLEPYASEK